MSSSSRSSRKRPRTEDLSGGGGLYDFLPPPDPEKDAAAKAAAEIKKPRRTKLPPEDKTKVIFLDVDGVLLAQGSIDMVTIEGVTLPMREAKESDFSAGALGNLRSIIEETGATIVMSSEWRRREELQNNIGAVLRSHDVPQVSDVTPIFTPKPELQKAGLSRVLDSLDAEEEEDYYVGSRSHWPTPKRDAKTVAIKVRLLEIAEFVECDSDSSS